MLRTVIGVVFGSIAIHSIAEIPQYQEPTQIDLQQQEQVVIDGAEKVEEMIRDGTAARILSEEQAKISDLQSGPGLGIQLPEYLENERDQRYMAKALAAGAAISEPKASPIEPKYPVILISLSMPESQIEALMVEAHEIGAAVAIRGLIDDDFEATIRKLKALAGENEAGVMIDPTLFRRFDAMAVPTFILPLESLTPCTDDNCSTPEHVRAIGSATLQYFLELIQRTGSARAKREAQFWLAKYGN